jgi:hypothetical protein
VYVDREAEDLGSQHVMISDIIVIKRLDKPYICSLIDYGIETTRRMSHPGFRNAPRCTQDLLFSNRLDHEPIGMSQSESDNVRYPHIPDKIKDIEFCHPWISPVRLYISIGGNIRLRT